MLNPNQPVLKSILTLFCLTATAIVTLATSKQSDYRPKNFSKDYLRPNERAYLVASNCPSSLPQQYIIIRNQIIVDPPEVLFSDFGLPTEKFPLINLKTQNKMSPEQSPMQFSGIINNQQRICKEDVNESSDSSGSEILLFNCYENGNLVCQITFEVPTNNNR